MAKKIIKKKTNVDPFRLTGDDALLLAEACKLDKQRKEAEKRLKEIKKSLVAIEKVGQYYNDAGDKLDFSERDNYTPIDSKELYEVMKKQKVGKFFWSCVKPNLTDVKKYVSETKINKLRKKLDPTPVFSFK
jgi:hypothetical protein